MEPNEDPATPQFFVNAGPTKPFISLLFQRLKLSGSADAVTKYMSTWRSQKRIEYCFVQPLWGFNECCFLKTASPKSETQAKLVSSEA